MYFREDVNNVIYGNYIKYNVKNLFEAIYISKHPNRVSKLNSLSEDTLAKKHIDIYKNSFKQLNDVNDFLLKYRVQCIQDWEHRKINLLPSFCYVEFKNNRWAPVIFENIENISITSTIDTRGSSSTLDEPDKPDEPHEPDELPKVDIQNYQEYVLQDDHNNNNSSDNSEISKTPFQTLNDQKTYPKLDVKNLSTIDEVNIKLKKKNIKSLFKNNPKLVSKMLTYFH